MYTARPPCSVPARPLHELLVLPIRCGRKEDREKLPFGVVRAQCAALVEGQLLSHGHGQLGCRSAGRKGNALGTRDTGGAVISRGLCLDMAMQAKKTRLLVLGKRRGPVAAPRVHHALPEGNAL